MIKKILRYITLFVFCTTGSQFAMANEVDTTTVYSPTLDHGKQAILISNMLKHYHFRKAPLNDSLSSVVLDTYLKNLDMNRIYFLQSDIDKYEQFRYQLDDIIAQGDVSVGFTIYKDFKERFANRLEFVRSLLQEDFDFTKDEYYNSDRKNAPWAENKAQLDEEWRKLIKNQLITLKLGGKTMEEAVKSLEKRYSRIEKTVMQHNNEDVFQLYMNAYAEAYDPHTSYFSPITSENFKINMSKSLEGIGARLQSENDYTTVYEIIPGGPAFKSKEIHKDDKIVAVAQGKEGEMVDVIGWRIDEVVNLIRGPKGSFVRLSVIPAGSVEGADPVEIILERDKVKIEDAVAEKAIYPVEKDGKMMKVGVITIPDFYLDFEAAYNGDPDYRSTTRDVRRLISELNEEGMDALVIDLRFNGGGSLKEAIELTGLFIPQGPVVQVKNTTGDIEVNADPDPELVYDGPLTVLVNRFSASASEIFAGAIQDYKRGVVMGEQTYGKGTVQNVFSLNRFLPGVDAELGQFKLTLAKFYRVTGSSTQHKGVTPDVNLPSAFSAEEFGESSQESALPWDQINATYFKPMSYVDQSLIERLNKMHKTRRNTERGLLDLQADISEMNALNDNSLVSLQESKRIKERDEQEKKKAEKVNKLDNTELSESELDNVKKEIDDKLSHDAYLKECLFLSTEIVKNMK